MDSSRKNTLSTLAATQIGEVPGNLPLLFPPSLHFRTTPPTDSNLLVDVQHRTQLTAAALETLPHLTARREPSVILQRYLDQGEWEEPWAAGYGKDI